MRGSLWLGYEGQGITRLAGLGTWESFGEQEGLTNPVVWRIVRDAKESFGLARHRGFSTGWREAGAGSSGTIRLPGTRTIYGLATGDDGVLWIGTLQTSKAILINKQVQTTTDLQPAANRQSGPNTGGAGTEQSSVGLIRYDPQRRTTRIIPFAAGAGESVRTVMRDEDGTVWIGTSSGLYRLAAGQSKMEPYSTPLHEDRVRAIRRRGTVLAVGGRQGVYLEQDRRKEHITVAHGLLANDVMNVAVGPDGEVWVTYLGRSEFSRIDRVGSKTTVRHFDVSKLNSGNVAYSLLFDARNKLWVTTDRGVLVQDKNRWIAYDQSDGMAWNNCNQQAGLTEVGGAVWIGTSNGLTRYTPGGPVRPAATKALITGVLRNDAPAAGTQFAPDTRALTIRFSLLSFLRQNTRFRYQLGGDEAPWAEIHAHEVRLAELPPGNYRFAVQGRNRNRGVE